MEFQPLHYNQTDATAKCVEKVISKLPFYSIEARTGEIHKYNKENLWTFVKDTNRCNIIAIENNEVVGFLFGVVDANVLFVIWIGMTEEHRRSNHMTTLWNLMETWCRENNIHKIWCDTNQLNTPSIKFMEKMGMSQCGILNNFWYGHDYFLWEKMLWKTQW
jgi:RimJ/RimL family protein N-acetyltransferase